MDDASTTPIQVLVVDDDPFVRSALIRMLAETEDITIAAQAEDGDGIPAALARHRIDVVLMDIRMSRIDGVAATRALRAMPTAPQVLMLTTFESQDEIRAALRAGAAGYMVKDSPPQAIENAIREVHAGRPALSPTIAQQLIDTIRNDPAPDPAERANRAEQHLTCLTAGERAVAMAVARGDSNAHIASELHLSENTVKSYLSRSIAKLGLQNRTQLAILIRELAPPTGP